MPSEKLLQDTSVAAVFIAKLRQLPGLTVTLLKAVHPLASVTVTEYEPGLNPLIVSVVAPVLHR